MRADILFHCEIRGELGLETRSVGALEKRGNCHLSDQRGVADRRRIWYGISSIIPKLNEISGRLGIQPNGAISSVDNKVHPQLEATSKETLVFVSTILLKFSNSGNFTFHCVQVPDEDDFCTVVEQRVDDPLSGPALRHRH